MRKEQRDKFEEQKRAYNTTKNNNEKEKIKKEIAKTIKQGIDHLKNKVDKDNIYKKYIVENAELITQKHGLNQVVDDYGDAIKLLKTLDIRKIFDLDVKLNVPFKSKIFFNVKDTKGAVYNTKEEVENKIEEMKADGKKIIDYQLKQNKFGKWTYMITYITDGKMVYINKLKNDSYRLFFKRNDGLDRGVEEENFDIINLYGIIMDIKEGDKEIVKQLCRLFNITMKYIIEQEEKYDFNIDMISNKKYIKSNYPILYEKICDYLYILEEVLEFGKSFVKYSDISFDGESAFGYRLEDLHKNLKEKNKSNLTIDPKNTGKLSVIVNIFCALGLLRKLRKKEVPKLIDIGLNGDKINNYPNYFIVKKYRDIDFIEAEKRIVKLKANGVSVTSFGRKKCKEILGEEIYDAVFSNNAHRVEKAEETSKNKKNNTK